MGLEFTLLWTVAAFYFLVRGGGAISVDHLLIWARILSSAPSHPRPAKPAQMSPSDPKRTHQNADIRAFCLDVPWAGNARDRWHWETGAPLRLIGPDLPDATTYEAECERGQDRENYYHSAHRYLLEASPLVCRTRGYRIVLGGKIAGDRDIRAKPECRRIPNPSARGLLNRSRYLPWRRARPAEGHVESVEYG
jgi:hypothetical protein